MKLVPNPDTMLEEVFRETKAALIKSLGKHFLPKFESMQKVEIFFNRPALRSKAAGVIFLHVSVILFGGGGFDQGVCVVTRGCGHTHPPGQRTTPPFPRYRQHRNMVNAPVGTHPTGMHSCFNLILGGSLDGVLPQNFRGLWGLGQEC